MNERDPLTNPQPGDFIAKLSGANRRMTRFVLKRYNNDIDYRDQSGKVKSCWISTWQEWARNAKVEGVGIVP